MYTHIQMYTHDHTHTPVKTSQALWNIMNPHKQIYVGDHIECEVLCKRAAEAPPEPCFLCYVI